MNDIIDRAVTEAGNNNESVHIAKELENRLIQSQITSRMFEERVKEQEVNYHMTLTLCATNNGCIQLKLYSFIKPFNQFKFLFN